MSAMDPASPSGGEHIQRALELILRFVSGGDVQVEEVRAATATLLKSEPWRLQALLVALDLTSSAIDEEELRDELLHTMISLTGAWREDANVPEELAAAIAQSEAAREYVQILRDIDLPEKKAAESGAFFRLAHGAWRVVGEVETVAGEAKAKFLDSAESALEFLNAPFRGGWVLCGADLVTGFGEHAPTLEFVRELEGLNARIRIALFVTQHEDGSTSCELKCSLEAPEDIPSMDVSIRHPGGKLTEEVALGPRSEISLKLDQGLPKDSVLFVEWAEKREAYPLPTVTDKVEE